MLNYFKSLLQLVLAPKEGWEDISIDDREPSTISVAGFFPLLGLTALTVFFGACYHAVWEFDELLVKSIVVVFKYIFAYFVGLWAFDALMPDYTVEEPDQRRIQTYLIYCVSLLAVIGLISNCLPRPLAFVQFMPLYVLLIMWRGADYLDIRPGRHLSFMVMAFCSLMLPPTVITVLYNIFKNSL